MENGRESDGHSQPALLLLFGGRGRNVCPLERNVITLGRANGCDFCLDAPEVSSLHCLIWRDAEGHRLRDCCSRSGTLRNGEPVSETAIHDGDILQIGSFCFRVYLPNTVDGQDQQELASRLHHIEQSRRNITRLALALRRRLQERQVDAALAAGFDLNRKASGLRHCYQAFQQRTRQLEQSERELAEDRALFEQEKQAFHDWLQQAEEELASREQESRQPGRWGIRFPWSRRQLERTP